MTRLDAAMVAPPPHVPADHVVDFDYYHPAGSEDGGDVYAALKRLHAPGLPDILWTPRHGGHWIVGRAEDVRWVRDEPVLLSRTELIIPRGMMNTLMPPVNVDPPYHARFRAVLNPAFTPGAIRRLTDRARAVAVELIEGLVSRGQCDFVEDVARIMPVIVFLDLLDLPTDPARRAEFLAWARGYLHAEEQAPKDAAFAQIAAYLGTVLDAREADPGTDVFSRIAGWRRNPRYRNEDEVMGMAMNAFLGGLDTVTAMMAFVAHHLATHPDARRRLIDDPALLPRAVEEYLRRHALSLTGRLITQDVHRKGVTMQQGEMLLVIDALAGIDERVHADPMTIDFDRDARVHDTFGNGVHRCVGEHLARLELTIFLEEWLRRLPEVRLDPALPPRWYCGTAIGMSQLGLRWD